MCRQAGCGQCVSEEHQGIFHSVNLIDTVYQEEKLTFFSSLKKLRIINEKLMNEISSHPNDTDIMLTNEAEVIALEFGEIFKTLEMKKKQLLEDIENQRSKKEKEFQIWKKMKETHKKTIENFLKDCEKLVQECDPQCFLEVACGLNTRMKTQLDLMNIASSYEKPPEYTQKKMDIKPVVNEILALKLIPVNVGVVKDVPSRGSENSINNMLLKNNVKQWKDQKNTHGTFHPVAGQEEVLTDGGQICTRLMSISEMSAFQNMSHEELRYKYYMEHRKLSDEFKTQTLPASKKYKCVTTETLKDKSSGVPFVSSPTKANNADRGKKGSLQRADGFEISFFSTSNHIFPTPDLNSSETNGNFKFFHEKRSQETSTLALSENFNSLVIKEEIPQLSAVTISNEMDANSSTSSGLKPSASVPVPASGSAFSDVSAERLSASPFAFSTCSNSLPRLIKDAATVSFTKKDSKSTWKRDPEDKIDDQDETKFTKLNSVTKTTVSDASASPEMLFSRSGTKKPEKKKTESHDKTLLNLEKSVSPERTELVSKHNRPKHADSFFPMNSSKKVENEKAVADSNSSFSQSLCSAAVPVKEETASFTQLTTSTKQEIKVKDEESRLVVENNCSCARKEDEPESVLLQNEACSVPDTCSDTLSGGSTLTVKEARGIPSDTDSDAEELSQTSVSSNNSSASEYFSVAEDKISARGKPET
nr:PREDICTED: uncharacterized protein LOC104145636 [Struthio camelus australis]